MAWKLKTLNAAVDKEIDVLPDRLLAKFLHIGDKLTELGPQVAPAALSTLRRCLRQKVAENGRTAISRPPGNGHRS